MKAIQVNHGFCSEKDRFATVHGFFVGTRASRPPLGCAPSFRLPSLQFRNAASEEPGDDSRELHLDELRLAELLHLPGGFEVVGKLAVLVAVAAISRRFRAVGFGAAALRVVLERHGTALAGFVRRLFHDEVGANWSARKIWE